MNLNGIICAFDHSAQMAVVAYVVSGRVGVRVSCYMFVNVSHA